MLTTVIKQMQQRQRELLDQFPEERREQNNKSWKAAKGKRIDQTFKITKANMRKQRRKWEVVDLFFMLVHLFSPNQEVRQPSGNKDWSQC